MRHDKRLNELKKISPSKPLLVIYFRDGRYSRTNPRTGRDYISLEQLQEYEQDYQILLVKYGDKT